MEESYAEGVAIRSGLESCAVISNGRGEALTEENTGRVLSRETSLFRSADDLILIGRQYGRRRYASLCPAPSGLRPQACVDTPCARTGRPSDYPTIWWVGSYREEPQGPSR